MLPRASDGLCIVNEPLLLLKLRDLGYQYAKATPEPEAALRADPPGNATPFPAVGTQSTCNVTEVEMQAEPLHQLFPARRAHDRFLRGVVNSVILGVAAWPVIIAGVMLIIR